MSFIPCRCAVASSANFALHSACRGKPLSLEKEDLLACTLLAARSSCVYSTFMPQLLLLDLHTSLPLPWLQASRWTWRRRTCASGRRASEAAAEGRRQAVSSAPRQPAGEPVRRQKRWLARRRASGSQACGQPAGAQRGPCACD